MPPAGTAVIRGTATRVHNRVAAKQQAQWADRTAAPVAAPPPAAESAAAPAAAPPARDTSAMLAQLKELGELWDAGVLTDAEFETQKARILS